MIPLINGVRHSWASIKFNALGRTFTGITNISYSDTKNKTNNYGAGDQVVSRGYGRYEATCGFTLHAYETEAIQSALGPGQRIQDIAPFDIVVSYINATDQLVTHVIRNVEFTNNMRDISEGDTVIEVEHETICSHIDWN